MMFSFIKKIKAKRSGFPFKLTEFWPPFYTCFSGKAHNDAKVLNDIYEAKIGEATPIFEKDGVTHLYIVRRITRSPGSDHIVSPLKFDLTYDKSITTPP